MFLQTESGPYSIIESSPTTANLGTPPFGNGSSPEIYFVPCSEFPFSRSRPSLKTRHTERAIIISSSVRMTRTVVRLASVEITPVLSALKVSFSSRRVVLNAVLGRIMGRGIHTEKQWSVDPLLPAIQANGLTDQGTDTLKSQVSRWEGNDVSIVEGVLFLPRARAS